MNKKLIATASISVILLAVGFTWSLAQSPTPNAFLVCVRKDGTMQVILTVDDCKVDKEIAITMYTQAGVDSRLASIDARLAAVEAENASLRAQVEAQESRLAALGGAIGGMGGHEARLSTLESLLAHFSRNGNQITISGANLHIVNGMGSTETANSLGNLVIGYNEQQVLDGACARDICNNVRTGSHMLVIGKENNFSSYGGIVSGQHNWVAGAFASVTGGTYNFARGDHSSISGGKDNRIAEGTFASSISGGDFNQVEGSLSTISGGFSNVISHNYSSVSGGVAWWLRGPYQWAAGDLSDDDSDQVHFFPRDP